MSPKSLKSDIEYLRHIDDEVRFLREEHKKTNKSHFFNDDVLKRAFVKSIEIIGEASNQLSTDFKRKYPFIEWKKLSSTRNHLVHGYFIIDYEIVWDIIENKIPNLEEDIQKIIQNEKSFFD
jgi:uncharacterized protein with HEPN domain